MAENNQTIFKVWRKGRFASFTYWADGGKVCIDIGTFNTDSGSLIGSCVAFVEPTELLTYLYAEMTSTVKKLYPKFAEEGFQVFGGKGDVARVFRSQFYVNKDDEVDLNSRVFRVGWFKGKTSAAGAIMPTKDLIKQDSIILANVELAELYHCLSIFLYRGALPTPLVAKGGVEHVGGEQEVGDGGGETEA